MRVFLIILSLCVSFNSYAKGPRIYLSENTAKELGIEFSEESATCDKNTPALGIRPRWKFRDSQFSGATLSVSQGAQLLMRGFLSTYQDPENDTKGLVTVCLNRSLYSGTSLILFYSKEGEVTEQVFINNLDEAINEIGSK